MENVTVLKSDLIAKVLKNRTAHIAEFAETIAGYDQKVIDTLDAQLANAHEGRDVNFHAVYLLNSKPQSHEKEYDRAIAMLEMSTNTHVTLTEHDFGQLVMDEWEWKQAFALSGSLYKGK